MHRPVSGLSPSGRRCGPGTRTVGMLLLAVLCGSFPPAAWAETESREASREVDDEPIAGAKEAAGSARPKHELVRILFYQEAAMRDGVKLSADVYLPRAEGRYPTLLIRTPYNKADARTDIPSYAFKTYFAERGYALAFQDVRGRGDSEGEFGFFHADVEDGFDSVEWAARQPWSNGEVCMIGVSYLGTVQWLAAKTLPPSLKCLVSTAAAGEPMDEIGYGTGGVVPLTFSLSWYFGASGQLWSDQMLTALMGEGFIDLEKMGWHRPLMTLDEAVYGFRMKHYRDFLRHPTMDAYWQAIKLQPDDFRNIDLPALHVTGWFDGDQPGAMHYWRGMNAFSKAKQSQYLVIGAWTHAQTFFGGAESVGELRFGPDAVIDPLALHLRFLDHYLKGTAKTFDQPKASVYVTGANEWREFDAYPPRQAGELRLYLDSAGSANSLNGDGRLRRDQSSGAAVDRYTFDPRNPVPGAVEGFRFFGADFRSIQAREDVLVYTGEALDEPIDVIGNVRVELYAASDARDTDFVVRLIDVHPDGRAVRLGANEGTLRARYREGFDEERLLTPGRVERYSIDLGEVGHRFLPGHRIRLEVTSSAYPMIAPNQNTGNPVAMDTEWKIARQTIHHDRERPSALVLSVVERED